MHSTIIVPRHRTRVFVLLLSPLLLLFCFLFSFVLLHHIGVFGLARRRGPVVGGPPSKKKIVRALPANGEFGDQPLLFGLAF